MTPIGPNTLYVIAYTDNTLVAEIRGGDSDDREALAEELFGADCDEDFWWTSRPCFDKPHGQVYSSDTRKLTV